MMFGEEAIAKGYLQQDDLEKALTLQQDSRAENDQVKFIGEILIDMNLMTEKQVLDVLTALHAQNA